MKNKLFVSVAFLLATVGAAIYLPGRTNSTEEATNRVANLPQSTRDANETSEKEQQTLENSDTGTAVIPAMLQYVGDVEPDFSIDGENAKVYRSYDEATLEVLAEGGDLLAIKELAHGIIRTNVTDEELQKFSLEEETRFWKDRQRKQKKYLELAIVYGDTELFDYAQYLYGNDYNTRIPEQVRNSLLEQLAFTEFAAMRGAQSFKHSMAPIIIKSLGKKLDGPVKLTDDDKARIRQRAQAIYDSYEHRREELGLGPFEDKIDNDPNIGGYDPLQIYLDAMGENAF